VPQDAHDTASIDPARALNVCALPPGLSPIITCMQSQTKWISEFPAPQARLP